MLTLILGGARSGKSRLAQRMAQSMPRVFYVATAEPPRDDPEMTARINQHRSERLSHWRTVEEPLALASSIEQTIPEADAIIVDCLTIWLSNLMWHHRDAPAERVEHEAQEQLRRIAVSAERGHVILVSNEVGCGIVPETPLGRAFRDLQGLGNQWAAEAADEVILTIAGLPLYLKPAARGESA